MTKFMAFCIIYDDPCLVTYVIMLVLLKMQYGGIVGIQSPNDTPYRNTMGAIPNADGGLSH